MRRFHRVLGLVLALPLILWVLTGLLFHIKHRYGEAYEALVVPAAVEPDWSLARVSPAQVIERGQADAPLTLGVHPSGRLAYYGKKADLPIAVDAATGEVIAAATPEAARAWVAAAVSASAHAERYGSEIGYEALSMYSARTRTRDPGLAVRMSGDKTVSVDLITGEITQTGALNDFIDAMYRVHYLQWTPWKSVNIALVLLSIPLALGLAASGLRMALRRR